MYPTLREDMINKFENIYIYLSNVQSQKDWGRREKKTGTKIARSHLSQRAIYNV